MKGNRALLLLLVGLLVLDVSWTAAVNNRAASIQGEMRDVERDQEVLASYVGMNASTRSETSVSVPLYAYETGSGEATVVSATVVSVPASGLYVDVSEVAQTAEAQRSAARAWTVANTSARTPAYRGGIVTMDAPDEWDTVGGGSAALALALGFAATDPCVSYNDSVAATGGLAEDGTVVDVRHVAEKAAAGRERGVDVFLAPAGQGASVSGVRVVEVETFDEATEYALDVEDSCGPVARAS